LAFTTPDILSRLSGRGLPELEKTAAMDAGRRIIPVPSDVSKPDSVNALFATVKQEFGWLDVLFNNAGLNAPGISIEDLTHEKWTSIVDVDLTVAFLCAQTAFRMMKDQEPRGGHTINNGSITRLAPGRIACR
jgi:NAD(P)-dependent dehydrogenase (short-subunit alcohol dehydrogenase family)